MHADKAFYILQAITSIREAHSNLGLNQPKALNITLTYGTHGSIYRTTKIDIDEFIEKFKEVFLSNNLNSLTRGKTAFLKELDEKLCISPKVSYDICINEWKPDCFEDKLRGISSVRSLEKALSVYSFDKSIFRCNWETVFLHFLRSTIEVTGLTEISLSITKHECTSNIPTKATKEVTLKLSDFETCFGETKNIFKVNDHAKIANTLAIYLSDFSEVKSRTEIKAFTPYYLLRVVGSKYTLCFN